MRSLLLPCALVLALSAGSPSQAQAPPPPDLAALQADLTASTERARALAAELERAAARDGGLREALEDLAQQSDAAQARLDARVRQVFMRGGPDPLASLVVRFGSPTVARAAQAGLSASVRAERDLVDAVDQQSDRVRVLQARAAAFRAALRTQAAAVLEEQERGRRLLAQALDEVERRAAAQQAASEQAAQQAALAAEQQRLQQAAGSGYPAGYAPTGQRISGQASWYGPGFVGSPTASGSPYDPERLTCAHKTLPLGTLVRVVRGDRAITCLVNDRGPFVGDRVLDLSRAGSRALGYDGVADVVAEVLARA